MRLRLAVIAVAIVTVWQGVLTAVPAQAGSICKDGTWTPSEGRGTCSYHGEVAQSGVPDPNAAPAPISTPPPSPTPTPTAIPTSTPEPVEAPAGVSGATSLD